VIRRRQNPSRYDIAFYVPRVGPLLVPGELLPAGGAETQIFLLSRELARRGLKVCVVVFDLPGVDVPSSVNGVAVSVRPPYRAHRVLRDVREAASIGRAIRDVDADVVVSRVAGPEIGLVGLFAKLSRRRFVYSSSSVWDFDLPRVSPKRRNRALFRFGIRLADDLIVQTEEQVRLCEERFARSPVLIRSMAEPAAQRDHERQAFLWIGRVVPAKQPLAYVDLARSLPEANFRMVAVPAPEARGGPDLRTALEESAAMVSNLDVLLPRPRQQLMDLVNHAVALVNTSDHEGMPNTFLEAWARGVPALALAHDPDGVIERYDLGAFARGSSERLVDLARRLWETRSDHAEVAERCRHYILENHSPVVVSARWQEVLGLVRTAGAAGAVPTH
jgi:glycosyltransferase involved in cell wall biosynthesis